MALPLPTIAIASPCSVPWSEMRGDERARFCDRCQKQVFDLSAMTTDAVAELLRESTRTPCIRFYKRTDGRVMTADCPVGLRVRLWRLLRRRAAWAASLFAMLVLPACRTATQGLVDYPGAHANPLAALDTPSEPASNSAAH